MQQEQSADATTTQTPPTQRSDADTVWKDMLEYYFEECINFFFPLISEFIDWEHPVEFLNREFQRLTRSSKTGRRSVDMLVKCKTREGGILCILMHPEVQGQFDDEFTERMLIYHGRIYDHYRLPVISVAILTDDDKNWRPNEFLASFGGCEYILKFPIVKISDYRPQREALEKNDNPFAMVVLAHLAVHDAKNRQSERLEYKKALTWHLYRIVYASGKNKAYIQYLFNFLDSVLALPDDLEVQYRDELHKIEEEMHMAYVSSIEKLAKKEGRVIGHHEGVSHTLKAIELLRTGYTVDEIEKETGLSKDEIEMLRQSIMN